MANAAVSIMAAGLTAVAAGFMAAVAGFTAVGAGFTAVAAGFMAAVVAADTGEQSRYGDHSWQWTLSERLPLLSAR